MIFKTHHNKEVVLRKLIPTDFDELSSYLQRLGNDTKKRFGPHQFDLESIIDFYKNPDQTIGYLAKDISTGIIVAYSIIKVGYLNYDYNRLQSYGINPNLETDCTFAPSVADTWQSAGVGNALFQFIRSDLAATGVGRIILWGGVQADNQIAVNFYRKNNFRILGQFEYTGSNYDMIMDIT
jgi:GNAT superfamily N-acetyltransferase